MAALSIAIAEAQKKRATRENRELQLRAELRLEELIKVGGIADHYERVNRRGNLEVETAFARVLHLVDTEAEKRAVVAAYMAWEKDERLEQRTVRGETDNALVAMKGNNPIWLDGAAVPTGSDGAA